MVRSMDGSFKRTMTPDEWNAKYPLDFWFRKKYNIRYNSQKHREANFIDVYFEYQEEKSINDYRKFQSKDKELENNYAKNGILQPRDDRDVAIDEDFFKENLSEFDD